MKLKGTINLIHKEDNSWIFKYTDEGVVKRVPFVYYSGVYQDGQEIEAYLETLAGIERAKPLFPLPYTNKVDDTEVVTQQPKEITEKSQEEISPKLESTKKVNKISPTPILGDELEHKLDKS